MFNAYKATVGLEDKTTHETNTPSFTECVVESMNLLETAFTQGFIIYPNQAQNWDTLSYTERKRLHAGMTTHDALFAQYPAGSNGIVPMDFRLKANVSASEALNTILTSGKTYIDCATAMELAYTLALRLACEKQYGKTDGQDRFDCFFGHKTRPIPTVQRLLFSRNRLLGGTKNYMPRANGTLAPLGPLAYFFNISEVANFAANNEINASNKNVQIKKLKVCSQIYWMGSSDYASKYPAGYDGGYNGIMVGFSSTDKPLIRVFGEGFKPLTPEMLTQKHVERYNKVPDEFNTEMITVLKRRGLVKTAPTTIKVDDKSITGIRLTGNIEFLMESYAVLLKAPLEEGLKKLGNFLYDNLEYRITNLDETQLLPEDMVSYSDLQDPDVYLEKKLGPAFMKKHGKIWTIVEDQSGNKHAELVQTLSEAGKQWFLTKFNDCTFEQDPKGLKVIIPVKKVETQLKNQSQIKV